MKRRLFLFASAVSLLICVASALLWALTCWRGVEFNAESSSRHGAAGEHRAFVLQAQRGWLAVTTQWYVDRIQDPAYWPADGVTRSRHSWASERDEFNVSFPWFHGGTIERKGLAAQNLIVPLELVSRGVSVPLWFTCAAAAVLPLWYWYLRRRLRKNARAGCCAECGYDLRATPDRCPECGTVALRI